MKVRRTENQAGEQVGWKIICPGCLGHFLADEDIPDEDAKFYAMHHLDERWTFNGDTEESTFMPSLLVYGNATFRPRCHSFIKDGKIRFLGDCTHELKNQEVDLIDFEEAA